MTTEVDHRVIIEDDEVRPDTLIEALAYRTGGKWGSGQVRSVLPSGQFQALLDRGVSVVRDLSALTEDDLRGVKGFGAETVRQLARAAQRAGVKFADDDSEPSILIRLKGKPAQRISEYASEIGITGSELMQAILRERTSAMETMAEWAARYTARWLRSRAEALQARADDFYIEDVKEGAE